MKNKKMTILILGLVGLSTLSQKLISSDEGYLGVIPKKEGGYSTLVHPGNVSQLLGEELREAYAANEERDFLRSNPRRKEKINQAKFAVDNLLYHTKVDSEMIKEVLSGLKDYIKENEEFENKEFREAVLLSIFATDDFEHDKDATDLALEILRILDMFFGKYNRLGKYERLEVLNRL